VAERFSPASPPPPYMLANFSSRLPWAALRPVRGASRIMIAARPPNYSLVAYLQLDGVWMRSCCASSMGLGGPPSGPPPKAYVRATAPPKSAARGGRRHRQPRS